MSASNPQLPPYHPDQPEVPLPALPQSIPDPPNETPLEDQIIPSTSPSGQDAHVLPPVVLGCATFGYGIYAETDDLLSDISLRTVRYALRAGINAFDTAPWYHPSEQVLGEALARLAPEHPRSSYQLITKVGKFGPTPREHMYDGKSTRASVERSLKRFHADYLDVVYLHDVEFVVQFNVPGGHHLPLLPDLKAPSEPLGPGEKDILEGLAELRALQKEGKVRAVGIAGFPLPVLVRVCLLAASRPDIGAPDIVQTYAHQTLQNSTLGQGYLAKFEEIGVGQVTNAAPLAMGVLTTAGAPEWHLLRKVEDGKAYAASREASEWCKANGTTLEEVAAHYGMKELRSPKGVRVPTVIGCKSVDEVKRTVKAWRKANIEPEEEKMAECIAAVKSIFEKAGAQGYSYESPAPS